MREHLLFILGAPMGAFGSQAGHERRGSELVPMRSAVLGLLGAALGVDRADTDAQSVLRRVRVAVRALSPSVALRDYHTVQTVPEKVKRPNGRRAAVEAIGRGIHTTITIRDYRADVAIAAAVWGEDLYWSLADLAKALRRPAFVLYLGRKSCPLAAPLDPHIVQASDPVAALHRLPAPDWLPCVAPGPVTCDPFPGGLPNRVERAPVEALDRTLWHFSDREIWHFDREADSCPST